MPNFVLFSIFKEIIRHENYSRTTNQNDIALIQTREEIVFTFDIRPAYIQLNLYDVSSDVDLFVIGWGSTAAESEF